MKKIAPLAIAALAAAAAPAHAAFTGDYSADHWTTSISDKGVGSAAMSSDGSALTLVSSDIPGLEETGAYLWYSIVMAKDATLSFDWSWPARCSRSIVSTRPANNSRPPTGR